MSEIKRSPETSEIKTSKKVNEIIEDIKALTLGQVDELTTGLKKELNIKEDVVISQPVATASASEKPAEKGGNVSIKVVKVGGAGINVIKGYGAIKDIVNELKGEGESINIVQAKKLAEEGDKVILKDIASDKAENAKKQLAEKGVEVEIK